MATKGVMVRMTADGQKISLVFDDGSDNRKDIVLSLGALEDLGVAIAEAAREAHRRARGDPPKPLAGSISTPHHLKS